MAACLRWKCYQAGTARVNWSELRWPLPIVQEHHCEHHSWLFFALQEPPRERTIIYCPRVPHFLTRTGGWEARIWNCGSVSQTRAARTQPKHKSASWGKRREGTIGIIQDNESSMKRIADEYKKCWCIGNVFPFILSPWTLPSTSVDRKSVV